MRTFGIIAACLLAFCAAWSTRFPDGRWRYRLTLEVDTPEGVKTGASVVEVHSWSEEFLPVPGSPTAIRVKGEAAAVDLGARGVLFAVLRSETNVDNAYWIVWNSFPVPGTKPGTTQRGSDGIRYYHSLQGKAEVPALAMPMLVRFRDINDPTSVERVEPDDLAKSFGPGVSLRHMTIEMVSAGWWPFNWCGITGEPVTTGIEKRLAWLSVYPEPGLARATNPLNPQFSATVHHGDFRRGLQ